MYLYFCLRIFVVIVLASVFHFSAKADSANEVSPNSLIWKNNSPKYWFEWWFFKIVDPNSGEGFSFLYGINNPGDTLNTLPGTGAYIKVIRFQTQQLFEKNIPLQEVVAGPEGVQMAKVNSVSSDSFKGFLKMDSGQELQWTFKMKPRWSFNAMGWASFFSNISNVGWYPNNASMTATGRIQMDGKSWDFANVSAYEDRTWGNSFPKWWAWLASDQFEQSPDTLLVAGGGPFRNTLDVFPISIRHKGKLLTFRPTEGASISIQKISAEDFDLTAINFKNQKIRIRAHSSAMGQVQVSHRTPQGGLFKTFQNLSVTITIEIYKRSGVFSQWVLDEIIRSTQGAYDYGSFGTTVPQ